MKKTLLTLSIAAFAFGATATHANKCKQACVQQAKSCKQSATKCKQIEQDCKNACR